MNSSAKSMSSVQLVERHLRLDHPELGQVAAGVRVLGTEGGSEGVDVGHRQGGDLRLELAGHGEEGFAAEEVLLEVDRAFGLRRIRGVEGRDAEHLPRPFGVRRGDDRRVQVEEAALLEEVVDGARRGVAHAPDRADRVGARSQVRDGAQELEAVSLLLQRVVVADLPHHLDLARLDLVALPLARRVGQFPAGDHRAAGAQRSHGFVAGQVWTGDHLDAGEAGTVRHFQEGHVLRMTRRAHPAADRHVATRRIVCENFPDRLRPHRMSA